jgi:hypothetical protein
MIITLHVTRVMNGIDDYFDGHLCDQDGRQVVSVTGDTLAGVVDYLMNIASKEDARDH